MILEMNENIIKSAEDEITVKVPSLMKNDLAQIVLYGSCARGDYNEDSDIDIALLTNCSREESKKYAGPLAAIATDVAMNTFMIVNFLCIPMNEFNERKSWYPLFQNIIAEGVPLYG